MSQKILLNDGTEFDVTWCGDADGILWIDGLRLTLVEAVTIFSDVDKIRKIIASVDIVHNGYTQLIHVSLSRGELMKVALRRGE